MLIVINTNTIGFFPAINAIIPLYTPFLVGSISIVYVPVFPGRIVMETFPLTNGMSDSTYYSKMI